MSMHQAPDKYPVSTGELLVIAGKQLGKKIPVVGDLIEAHNEIMAKVEANRLAELLQCLENRITDIESNALKTENGQSLLLIVAGAVREEPRPSKIPHYANFIITTARALEKGALEDALRTLEGFRQLDLECIALLRRFINQNNLPTPMIAVSMLSGILSTGTENARVPDVLQSTLTTIMRLQGLGLVTVVPGGKGGLILDTSRFEPVLRQEVWLTDLGRNILTICLIEKR